MEKLVYFGVCLLGCLAFCPTAEGARNRSLALPRSRCPPGAFYFQKMCYEYLKESASWQDAEVSCQYWRKGNLASILNEVEGAVISSYAKSVSSEKTAWIGLNAITLPEKLFWMWSDGSEYIPGSQLWDKRTPDTMISDNKCITLINLQKPNEKSRWKQTCCSDKRNYICKYKAAF
ncbi:regenerating islet-derived protein 4 [Anolis carolinensis]|uniref:C-type lectin domain-containing protein n=1 Tax=Anolis carolinensis TaxID=28377 RepID=H9GRN9_ANOCA|nr:PREDICTED: regenerating islet-derived protein 4 [Anolis carolinensis]|eukprot:XP_008120558.1 PREDICTED: regenerating islet-derived protein 4 [Anolis carolinensis]